MIAGGRSNLTYAVTDGTTCRIVRRQPLGHVQATAHDMGREHTVMTALAPTPVPVPRTFARCDDTEVLGATFYVMEHVAGTPYRSRAQLEELGADATRRVAEAMVDTLAALHAVDPAEVGLAGFGRPEGFVERQVRRWGQQLEGSHSRDLAGADELRAELARRAPGAASPDHTIVHGDYRLDNLLVDAAHEGAEVRAVVDWEMATLGDPLTDLALLAVYDQLAGLDRSGLLVTDASTAPGFPSTDEQLQRYSAQSGRDLGEMSFHLGLAYFKLAVILEGIHYRFLQGQTVGEGFDRIGDAVEPLLGAGLDALRR
nr:phosphotransferase family protein [Nocardioides perillae]